MNVVRDEIRTGVLVAFSLTILVAVLLYLGAPGVFVPMKTFWIYCDNAAGLKPGASVLLGGRQVGQVRRLYSPVAEIERPAEAPQAETLIEVRVERSAAIYRNVKVYITQTNMLSDMLLDFTSGSESEGPAPSGAYFIATRTPGLNDAAPLIVAKVEPTLKRANEVLDEMRKTIANITKITDEGGDLRLTLGELKTFSGNLNSLTGPESSLRHSMMNLEALTNEDGKLGQSLENIKEITSPEGSLSKTFKNAEKFTHDLSTNKDINATLKNLRDTSTNLNDTIGDLGDKFSAVGTNLEQATDTVKRQPWRLIWPSTKKYGDEPPKPPGRGLFGGLFGPKRAPQPVILVPQAAPKAPVKKRQPRATPKPAVRARTRETSKATPVPESAAARRQNERGPTGIGEKTLKGAD